MEETAYSIYLNILEALKKDVCTEPESEEEEEDILLHMGDDEDEEDILLHTGDDEDEIDSENLK